MYCFNFIIEFINKSTKNSRRGKNILQNRMAVLLQSVNHLGQMLGSLSYKSVLSRGYAIVRDANNNIISRTNTGTPATIEFADGVLKL